MSLYFVFKQQLSFAKHIFLNLYEYSVILTTSFYYMNHKEEKKRFTMYFQNFSCFKSYIYEKCMIIMCIGIAP